MRWRGSVELVVCSLPSRRNRSTTAGTRQNLLESRLSAKVKVKGQPSGKKLLYNPTSIKALNRYIMSWTSENRLQKRHTVDRVLYKKDEEINLGLKSPLDLLAKHA